MCIDHVPKILSIFSDNVNLICLTIGRLSFPLFAWELVQCYHFCSNKKKHIISLLCLAILSEPIYNLAFESKLFYFDNQNICFTLLIGWLLLCIYNTTLINKQVDIILKFLITISFGCICYFLNFDYGYVGLLFIILVELSYHSKYSLLLDSLAIILFIILKGLFSQYIINTLLIYSTCILDIFIIYYFKYVYNSKKSFKLCKPLKVFLSYFYILHLICLLIIKYMIGCI